MPRDEVRQYHETAQAAAATVDPGLIVLCMGSYLRGAPDCGDVDFIVTRDTRDGRDHAGMIKQLWLRLIEVGMIKHSLADPHDWGALSAK